MYDKTLSLSFFIAESDVVMLMMLQDPFYIVTETIR